LFVFVCKSFFQLIAFMYVMKLKGRDGKAVYKSLHFSPDYIGNFPEVGEKHADGGGHWRFFLERIDGSFTFLAEIFHDAAISVCFGVSVFISMLLVCMNSLCMTLYVLAIL